MNKFLATALTLILSSNCYAMNERNEGDAFYNKPMPELLNILEEAQMHKMTVQHQAGEDNPSKMNTYSPNINWRELYHQLGEKDFREMVKDTVNFE